MWESIVHVDLRRITSALLSLLLIPLAEAQSTAGDNAIPPAALNQQESARDAMARFCTLQANMAADPYAFMDKGGSVECPDAALKKTYCTSFQSYKPFTQQQETEARLVQVAPGKARSTPFKDSLALCGLDASALHDNLCGSAERDNQLPFLAKQCPVQAKLVATRECAGRSYTSVPGRYRELCATYAKEDATATTANPSSAPSDSPPDPKNAAAQAAAAQTKEAVKDKAKSILKGLFGK
jgi:hypothetical protein